MPDDMDIIERQTFGDVLREMDLEHLVMGEYGITVEEAANFVDHDHFQFLDLRAHDEHDHLLFPFALHIPIHELPDRIDEVPDRQRAVRLIPAPKAAANGSESPSAPETQFEHMKKTAGES